MSEERKKSQKRNWNDRPIMLQPDLKKSKESSAPTQASSQASSQNSSEQQEAVSSQQPSQKPQQPSQQPQQEAVSSQQPSQADSQQFVAIPENDTPNPPAVSEQEAQLPFQDALTLSCPDGSTIHLKIESSQARSSKLEVSVKSQDLNIEIKSEPNVASPAPNCRLL